MSKRMSRARRLSNATSDIQGIADQLRELVEGQDLENMKEKAKKELVKEANALLENLDFSEIECLKEEMESWRDNMDNANMSHLPKYEEVSTCCDELDNATLDTPTIEDVEDVEGAADELEQTVSDLDGVSFPGMF